MIKIETSTQITSSFDDQMRWFESWSTVTSSYRAFFSPRVRFKTLKQQKPNTTEEEKKTKIDFLLYKVSLLKMWMS